MIYIVRHGESENNVLGVECNDISNKNLYGLTKQGVEETYAQANATGPISKIITSPLRRALETSQIFAEVWGSQILEDPLLAELNVGEFENRPDRERLEWKLAKGESFDRYPGGESREQVRVRAREVLNALNQVSIDEDLLLVSHGGFIRCFMEVLNPSFTRDDWERYLDQTSYGRRIYLIRLDVR